MDQRQSSGLKSARQLHEQPRRTIARQQTLKSFSVPWPQLLSMFSCFSPTNMTDCLILNSTWKIIAAVVIHFPVCPSYSSELHSSASTPPPQRMNQRVHENQSGTLSRAIGNICAHFIMEHALGW